MKFTNILAMTLLVAGLSLTGCRTMEFGGPNWINQSEKPRFRVDLPFQKKTSEEDEYGTPQKMAVIWKETDMRTPGKPAVRGFGGRIYFYDNENKPVRVDGEFVVYGFDAESDKTSADKKFVFKKEHLQSHYSKTEMGHSYSFWIPWDQVGGTRMSVSLIPAFKTAEGKLVKGGHTVNVLPGKAPQEKDRETTVYTGKDIRLTSGDASGEVVNAGHSDRTKSSGVRETTIRLPKHLANRVANVPKSINGLNAVATTRKAIEVLNEKGEVIDRRAEATQQRTERDEEGTTKKRERKPFGMPAPFNN